MILCQLHRHPAVGVLFCVFGERAVGEAPRGGEASWYCVDLADAFRLLLSRKKNIRVSFGGIALHFQKTLVFVGHR